MSPRLPPCPAMNVPHTLSRNSGWFHRAGVRAFTWWPVKLAGMTLGLTAFFVAYFWLLQHPRHPVTIVPLTAVDQLVGFRPEALPLYLSLWLYLSLAPALLINRRELTAYALAAVALSVIGLGTFFFWPTAVPASAIDWSRHPAFAWLKAIDATGNACPSLHVAFAVFTVVWLERLLRQMGTGRVLRIFNWLWCAGILYSTVAIRQHVALDVLAGVAVGALVAAVNLRLLRAFPGPLPAQSVS